MINPANGKSREEETKKSHSVKEIDHTERSIGERCRGKHVGELGGRGRGVGQGRHLAGWTPVKACPTARIKA
jgi:hypothetical protein